MVLGRKTNFFLGKTKKKTKKTSFKTLCGQTPKKWFFLVFPRKKLVLDGKTNFSLRKKMVLDRKTNIFLGKRWFWAEEPTFS